MISKIKWSEESEDQDLLSGLSLDFTRNGKPVDTVILAGENGSGKTSVLNDIKDFMAGTRFSVLTIEYYIDGVKYIRSTADDENLPSYKYRSGLKKEFPDMEDDLIDDIALSSFGSSEEEADKQFIRSDPTDIRNLDCQLIEARSGLYGNEKVEDNRVDEPAEEDYSISVDDLFTELEDKKKKDVYNTYIDIETDDAEEFKKSFDDINQNTILSRMDKAFNSIFDTNIKFYKIEKVKEDPYYEEKTKKKLWFKKNGRKILLDDLSAGERQIIINATKMIVHQSDRKENIVLIDEPELSLHPRWQLKLISFYRALFTDEDGQLNAQFIIATHSEYIIKAACRDENAKVIILENKDGKFTADKIADSVLPQITSAEVNYLAFNIADEEYFIQLFAAIQKWMKENSSFYGTGKNISQVDRLIKDQPFYRETEHRKPDDSYEGHHYETLPVYIRNKIDHPDSDREYLPEELEKSILLLRNIYANLVS